MNNETITILILFAITVLIIVGIVNIVKDKHRGSAAPSVFHDMQNKEKQNATVIVIEEKAGKKMQDDESGEKLN